MIELSGIINSYKSYYTSVFARLQPYFSPKKEFFMKICAVICEYDPFHRGHEYQIAELKRRGYSVIAIMSGCFTQRGTAAVIDKYKRARSAVMSGADVVFELPFPFCASGASTFALGGVRIAEKLGIVDTLAFGSETGDAEEIKAVAANMLSDEYSAVFEKSKQVYESYSQRQISAYERVYGRTPVLEGSNDLLALEYVKAIIKTGSKIIPLAVKREGQAYGKTDGEGFLSASSVRKMIFSGDRDGIKAAVPRASAEEIISSLDDGKIARTDKLFLPYAAKFRAECIQSLRETAEMTDELCGRLINSAKESTDFASLVLGAQARLYSESRVRRAMLFSLLGVRADEINEPTFTVLLGAGKEGRRILSMIKKSTDLPIITKPADYVLCGDDVINDFELILRAEALWTLCLDRPSAAGELMKRNPFISE